MHGLGTKSSSHQTFLRAQAPSAAVCARHPTVAFLQAEGGQGCYEAIHMATSLSSPVGLKGQAQGRSEELRPMSSAVVSSKATPGCALSSFQPQRAVLHFWVPHLKRKPSTGFSLCGNHPSCWVHPVAATGTPAPEYFFVTLPEVELSAVLFPRKPTCSSHGSSWAGATREGGRLTPTLRPLEPARSAPKDL